MSCGQNVSLRCATKEEHQSDCTNGGGVILSTKDQFRGSIVAGANVGHIRFTRDEDFGATKVAQFQDARVGIQE